MLLSEISPHIRYAQIFSYEGTNTTVCTYDCRLFYVLSGNGFFQINHSLHELAPNTLLFIQSGTPYQFILDTPIEILVLNFDLTPDHSHITTTIPPSIESEFDHSKILQKTIFSDSEYINTAIIRNNMENYKNYLMRIINEFNKKLLYYDGKCSAILKTILLDISRELQFNSPVIPLKLEKTLQYIEANYTKELTNDELARVSGYHPYHLNRLMLNYTGVSLHHYLVNYRLEKSKIFLANDSLTISEISDMCGFNSPYYYSNAFKKKFGTSPSTYRKNYGHLL